MNLNMPTAKWWHELVSPGTHQVTEAKQTQLTKAWLRGQPVIGSRGAGTYTRLSGAGTQDPKQHRCKLPQCMTLWSRNQLENQV